MSSDLHRQVSEWQEWYEANSQRPQLYYRDIPGTAPRRQAFVSTLLQGNLSLLTRLVQELYGTMTMKEGAMSAEVIGECARMQAWYAQHVRGVEDPEKMWALLLRAQGETLRLCAMLAQELDRVDQAAAKASVFEWRRA
jgi:hypothetical protein